MQELLFTALLLATTVIFPSWGQQCTFSDRTLGLPGDVQNEVLALINDRREKLAKGEQKNGGSGTLLPPAKQIDPLKWSCEIEEEVAAALKSCPSKPTAPSGKTAYFKSFYYSFEDKLVPYMRDTWLYSIDISKFDSSAIGDEDVKYVTSSKDLREYANLVREDTTEIGCSSRKCSSGTTIYCLTNQPELTASDIIYHRGVPSTTTTASTTTTTTTTTTSSTTPTTTATTARPTTPTTTATTTPMMLTITTTLTIKTKKDTITPPLTPSPTTEATTTTPPPMLTNKSTTMKQTVTPKATGYKTTSCIPRRKVTMVTPQLPVFPPADSNTRCPSNTEMNDEIRFKFLDMHNYRRAQLAKGKVAKRNGNYLPQSADMQRMRYDCSLEKDVINFVSTCPTSKSAESSRPDVGENFVRIPEEGLPTFLTATQRAVTSWWKVISTEEGPGLQVYFRQKHLGTPIESFTQMGWSTSRKLACAIARCNSDYVAVCRYSPKGNHVEQVIYKKGTPCTECVAGSWCTEDALCTLE